MDIFLLFIGGNLVCFAAYALDKWLAQNQLWRVSEKNLLMLSFAGPIGALFGVYFVRHKSQKKAFLVNLWVVAAIAFFAWAYAFFSTVF